MTTFPSERGAPVVAPSRELPPGPHERDGFPISFWEYVEPDPNRTPAAADCSAMLVDLHEVLRSYPGELPMLGAGDIPRMMEELDPASDILSAADENLLRASAERLRPFWETLSGDIQPITATPIPETSSPRARAALCGSTSKTSAAARSSGISRR